MTLRCVLVGYGRMGALHHAKLTGLGVRVVGVVDSRLSGSARASAGLPVISPAGAARLRPDLWDICVPTAAHAAVLAEVCGGDARAHVIVEKPLCAPGDVPVVRGLLAAHRGRVVVGEHYLSSAVLERVAEATDRLGLVPRRVTVEMSKHRGRDVSQGRFQDRDLGALGYEGPHLVAVVDSLGRRLGLDPVPEGTVAVEFHGAADGAGPTQDGVEVRYRTRAPGSHCEVSLYSSMTGRIGHPGLRPDGPALASSGIGPGSDTRYRAVRVEGVDPQGRPWQVTGAFEPVPGLPRNHGTVTVRPPGQPAAAERHVVRDAVRDDSLGRHLARTLAHFQGLGPNPAPPGEALDQLALLHAWSGRPAPAPSPTTRQPLCLGVPT
ncbi:Gfo/Idh/MocA family oxidoreductase [Streptomyces sp. NPDC096339]|uniref:Gfo/Idh/MocA family oxidoreductase n=1 Tax=Streptomyces sp. NPDC096339 TaxID=3366086 RepID=UPI003804BDFD